MEYIPRSALLENLLPHSISSHGTPGVWPQTRTRILPGVPCPIFGQAQLLCRLVMDLPRYPIISHDIPMISPFLLVLLYVCCY